VDLEIISTGRRFYEVPDLFSQLLLELHPENVRLLPKKVHVANAESIHAQQRAKVGFWVEKSPQSGEVSLVASNGRETKRYMGNPDQASIELKIWLEGQLQVPPQAVVEEYRRLKTAKPAYASVTNYEDKVAAVAKQNMLTTPATARQRAFDERHEKVEKQ